MRFLRAVRRCWLPIVVGAAWGTAVACVASVTLLVAVEAQRVEGGVLMPSRDYDFVDFGLAVAALVMGFAQAGAVYGYITRRGRCGS